MPSSSNRLPNLDSGEVCAASRAYLPTFTLLFYLPIVLATAALIAPWLYHTLGDTLPYPFHRYVNRSYLISALLWLPLLLFILKIKSPHTLGWHTHQSPTPFKQIQLALLTAILTTAAAILTHTLLRWHEPNAHLFSLKIITAGLLPALLIAPIEEILFRGIAQHALSRTFSPLLTCLLTAIFFALLHFIKVKPWPAETPITALSGFQALAEASSQAFITCFTQPRGFGLLIAGLCLSFLRHRSGSLWLPIGLHAGWILGQKAVMRAFDTTAHTPPWAEDLLSSPIAWVTMILGTAILARLVFPIQETKT
jgi:membrane protease YdiL (CAAX protease family)